MDDKHQDQVDEHWTAVCHHAETVMFDEGSPFAFALSERVISLTPESSTSAWELAGFQVTGDHPGTGHGPRTDDRAKR